MFKDLEGYEGLYAIQKNGRVWAYPRFKLNRYKTKTFKVGHWMTIQMYKGINDQYPTVKLTDSNGVPKLKRVHRAVAETFLPKDITRRYVNHRNGNKLDYRLSNLEWVTCKENYRHAVKTGLIVEGSNFGIGVNHISAKLNPFKVRKIRDEYSKLNISQRDLAERYGVSNVSINFLLRRRTWKSVI